MRTVLDCLDRLDVTNPAIRGTRGLWRSLTGAVHDAEITWVDSAFFGQFINNRLRSHGRIAGTGSAVSCRLWPVHHDVVGIDQEVRDVVRCHDRHRASADGRARKGPRLISHPDLSR